jgi:hypothetical protein
MNIDTLLGTFNFKLFHYGVAFDDVPTSWFVRYFTGKKSWKRYWIFRKLKVINKAKEDIEVFCQYLDIWDEKLYLFFTPSEITGSRKIVYFSSSHEPMTMLESLKAKLDAGSLGDHTLFNTKDLGW